MSGESILCKFDVFSFSFTFLSFSLDFFIYIAEKFLYLKIIMFIMLQKFLSMFH